MWIELDEFRMINLDSIEKIECEEYNCFDGKKAIDFYSIVFYPKETYSTVSTLSFRSKKQRDDKYKYIKKLLKDM